MDEEYTRVEYERRFLVPANAEWRDHLEPYSKTFEDSYIIGSRLRLRALADSDSERQIFKLTRKAESTSPYYRTISRILLTREEYQLLDRLPGLRLKKVRYYHILNGQVFSVDVFEGALEGLILSEVEADSLETLLAIKPPSFAGAEVTTDAFFEGASLCHATREDLLRRLSRLL